MVTAAMKLKDTCSLEEKLWLPRQHIKKQRHTLPTKVHLVKAMVFFSSHVWMWDLDYKESWALKNWCFLTVVLEKTLESPLDCKAIQPVHRKGNQSWMFIGRTGIEAETPIHWPPDVKSWLIWKDPDAGNYWRREEKGTTEDEMVRWHHRLNGHKFEHAPGVGHGQGNLVCCSPRGRKELDTTDRLNNNKDNWCNHTVLSERSQSQEATVYMIPFTWHSGKGTMTVMEKRSMVATG